MIPSIVGLVLLVLRFSWTFIRDTPLITGTSGFEEEALFSLWKCIQGQPVYTALNQSPFSGSYFNGLFYLLYGWLSQAAMSWTSLSEAWLPWFTRATTFALFLLTCGLLLRLMRSLLRGGGEQASSRGALVFTLFFATSPLLGWWIMTTRPDIAGLGAEVLLLILIVPFLKQPTTLRLASLAGIALIAWGFRQTNLGVAGCLVTWLLLHRRWAQAGLFAGLLSAGAAITLLLAGDIYAENTLLANTALPFDPTVGFRNLLSTLGKAPWLILALSLAFPPLIQALARKTRFDDLSAFLAASTILSFGWALLTSTKTGASDNYFFTAATLGGVFLFVRITSPSPL